MHPIRCSTQRKNTQTSIIIYLSLLETSKYAKTFTQPFRHEQTLNVYTEMPNRPINILMCDTHSVTARDIIILHSLHKLLEPTDWLTDWREGQNRKTLTTLSVEMAFYSTHVCEYVYSTIGIYRIPCSFFFTSTLKCEFEKKRMECWLFVGISFFFICFWSNKITCNFEWMQK